MLMVNLFAEDMRMRKFIVLLLVVTLLLVAFSGCNNSKKTPINNESTNNVAGEQNQPAEPNPASDFEYETNSTQTGILINKYIGSSEHVLIPSYINDLPVLSLRGRAYAQQPTAIEEGAFEGTEIQTVVIPDTVKVIGYKCFKDCQNLLFVTISLNSSLTNINSSAFENCTKLEKLDISSTQVKEIGTIAFRGCTSLRNIVFSNKLEQIGEKAFYENSSLLEVDFPESLTDIKGGAFAYCISLKKITIPTKLNLTSLDESIFRNVPNMEQIVFKEGRESILGYALINTDADVEIVIPSSVKNISPLPFHFNPPAQITLTFLGDAPTILEDKDVSWLDSAIIRYNPETTGWESFVWKDKVEMKQSNQSAFSFYR